MSTELRVWMCLLWLGLICACSTTQPAVAGLQSQALLSEPVETSIRVGLVRTPGDHDNADPVILTKVNGVLSSAFRITCTNCTKALAAFGYGNDRFIQTFEDLPSLLDRNRLTAADADRFITLPLEDDASEPAIITALRVVDAAPGHPSYLVRLRANPSQLYATTCSNLLEVAHGSLETIPITAALIAHWGISDDTTIPHIACASSTGRKLPPPAAADSVTTRPAATSVDGVWALSAPQKHVSDDVYPYLITHDGTGAHGFALGCASEVTPAMQALGFEQSDVSANKLSEAELSRTHFGEQPVITCGQEPGAEVSAIVSSNDAFRSVRFQFGDQPDLVEFACAQTESYFRTLVGPDRTFEVPAQALAYVNGFDASAQPARLFRIGCRTTATWLTDYLKQLQGTLFLTGQHNREPNSDPAAWTEKVHALTGRYPAIWGGDFLYAETDVRRRQTLIDEAKKQWQNGSIVKLTWHVCPPTTGSTCSWDGELGITAKLQEREWNELVTTGSALNSRWLARLDEIVPFLQELKDAGVPVILRLLHDSNDSLAWWAGRPGDSGSLKLFQLTHDYLTQTQHLDHLVWEWSVNDTGNSGDLAGYYPGSAYADIVSLSPWRSSFPSRDFYEAIKTLAGGKPIALSTVPKLPTCAQLASQPDWTHFMVWAEDLTIKTSQADVGATYNCDRAVNQQQIPFPGTLDEPHGSTTNLALGKPAQASSQQSAASIASNAVDGYGSTRWVSRALDDEWIYVDLGSSQVIRTVRVDWDDMFAKAYKIEVSDDAQEWTQVFAELDGRPGAKTISLATPTTQYVRLHASKRGTGGGYALRELAVFR